MKIIGLDASMNGSGVVSLELDQKMNVISRDYLCFTTAAYISERSNSKIKHWKPEMFSNYLEKNLWFHNHILEFARGAEYLAIENYSFASQGQTFSIGEFTGLLKFFLYATNIKIRLYAPTVVKKFATSYGAQGKNLVVDAYDLLPKEIRFDLDYLLSPKNPNQKIKTDLRYESPRADIIDAYWLAECLLMELRLRNGFLDPKDLDKKKKEIFIKVPKKAEVNVLNSEFLYNEKNS